MNHHSTNRSEIVHITSLPEGKPFSSSYDRWTTTLDNAPDLHHIQKMVPLMVTLPNIFDNITVHNNALSIQLGTHTTVVTIDTGFYDMTRLTSTLQAALRTFAATKTLPQDQVVQQNSTSGLIEIQSPTNPLTVYPTGQLDTVIGYTSTNTANSTASMFGSTTPNLNTHHQILLHCNQAENNSIHSTGIGVDPIGTKACQGGKRSHLLCVLDFSDTQRGAMKAFKARDLHQWEVNYNSTRDLRTWSFQLTDNLLRPVYLPGNVPVDVYVKLISYMKA
jgi:hypothetical protein